MSTAETQNVPYRKYFLLTVQPRQVIFPIRNRKTVADSRELGEVIRSERKRLKVTQKKLAMTVGTGLRFLIELERGKPTARMEGVFKVLQALGLKLNVASPADRGAVERR